MSQRAEIVSKIARAKTAAEQMAAVNELDAYDRQRRTASAEAASLDWAGTTVGETLRPVAVHERSTIATDWLGEISTTSAREATDAIHVEASLWYRRLSPEVKADREEFAEQARGMARRTASAHGEQAPALEAQFLQYVGFLHTREAASGLPQVQQQVDSFENPAPQALPEQTFDNFAPPVDPINAGVVGTETSERAPLIQEVLQEGGGQTGAPTHHDQAPQPYTYAEVPPGQQAVASLAEPLFTPSVAINHTMNLDDFKRRQAASGPTHAVEYNEYGGVKHSIPLDQIPADGANGWKIEHDATGIHATGPEGTYHRYEFYPRVNERTAASGLDQVQQVVDSFEEPDETALPTEVAFPWEITPDAGGQAGGTPPQPPSVNPSVVKRREAVQRRAAYVASLAMKDPASLTETERREISTFTASLQTVADQWSQSGPQYKGPSAQNSPATTPASLAGDYAAGVERGRADWPGQAPDFADASSSIPPFAEGVAQGYQQAAQADPTPGSASADMLPPGAGGEGEGYQTKAASLQAEAKQVQCAQCGRTGNHYDMKARGTGNAVQHICTNCSPIDTDPAKVRWQGSLKVSASFTSPVDVAQPEFAKGYKYAAKWTPGTRLVTTGSAAFEAGLYAGISDNPEHQGAWVTAHRKQAAKYNKPEFGHRIAKHREFSKTAQQSLPEMRVHGAYLRSTTAKTAATVMDLDTTAPQTSPSPTGETPINGPGEPGPLAGGTAPAAAGGPSPYNGAAPFGAPVVPNGGVASGQPTAISTIPGAPVDKAALEHLSPQTAAFRRQVQANLLRTTAAQKKVPVCKGCGETFESREVAEQAHGKHGCGTREDGNTGYKMTPENEAW